MSRHTIYWLPRSLSFGEFRRATRVIRYRAQGRRMQLRAWIVAILVRLGWREERGYCAICKETKRLSEMATEEWEANYSTTGSYVIEGITWFSGKPIKLGDDYACKECVSRDTGLGKFALGDAESLILYAWSMDGAEDDFMSNDSEYCGRFGQWLLYVDSQGFVSSDHYDTKEKAIAHFQSLYDDGMGASEDDGYISFEHGEYHLLVEGKHIGSYPREMRARAAMRIWASQNGFYPSLWVDDQRYGNLRISSY